MDKYISYEDARDMIASGHHVNFHFESKVFVLSQHVPLHAFKEDFGVHLTISEFMEARWSVVEKIKR